jgi:glutamyl-tRNA synthetase
MNGQYMAAAKAEEILPLVKNQASASGKGIDAPDGTILKVIELYKVRMKTLPDFMGMTDHFFSDEYSVEDKGAEKYLTPPESKKILGEFVLRLEKLNDFKHTSIEEMCRSMAVELGIKVGAIIHPTRVAISGKTTGAGLFEMMEVLGQAKVVGRMKKAVSR